MAPLVFALSNLTDDELRATAVEAYDKSPHGPRALLAWIEHCIDTEQYRRRGVVLPLSPPEEVIPPEEDVAALAAKIVLWEAEDAETFACFMRRWSSTDRGATTLTQARCHVIGRMAEGD